MKIITDYKLGDILEFKKPHPCGATTWLVIRYGADIKLQCTSCKRIIMDTRVNISKMIKKIHRSEEIK